MMENRTISPGAVRQVGTGGQTATLSNSQSPHSLYNSKYVRVNVQTPQGARNIGFIVQEDGKRYFLKRVYESKHLQKCYNAWGIDKRALFLLKQRGVTHVRIETLDTNTTEEVPLEIYPAHGIEKDFGFGLQVFLPRKHFRRIDKAQKNLQREVG